MDLELLEKLGKIAGIAGIAFGAFFLIFRSIIQKNLFSRFDNQQSFRIINTMILIAAGLTVLGLGSWLFLELKKTETEKADRLASKFLVGTVVDEDGAPISHVTIELTQFPSIREYSDSDGRFVVTLSGTGARYVDLLLNHRDYQPARKKVKVDYDDRASEIDLGAMAIRKIPSTQPEPVTVEPERQTPSAPRKDAAAAAEVREKPRESTSITLVYAGDPYGCALDLVINVAGQSIKPASNSVLLTDVPLGDQSYAIHGNIYCGAIGSCNASGSSRITVRENGVYNLMWANDNFAHCSITLVDQADFDFAP